MSRILKRPMFRKGGSANNGIMTGLVDRKGYQYGTSKEEILKDLRTDAPRDTSMYEMLIGGGLNLVSGAGAGEGLMSNVARSYKGPSETFFERQRAAREYDRKLEQTAGQMAVQHRLNLAEIKAKDSPQTALHNVYLKQGIEDGMDGPTAERYATYQSSMKKELEDKVGATRIADDIIDFNMQDKTTKGNKKKIANLKKHVGKFVYDVFDGNIKLIQIIDGQIQYKTYNSVADIKAEDLIPPTAEEKKVKSMIEPPEGIFTTPWTQQIPKYMLEN